MVPGVADNSPVFDFAARFAISADLHSYPEPETFLCPVIEFLVIDRAVQVVVGNDADVMLSEVVDWYSGFACGHPGRVCCFIVFVDDRCGQGRYFIIICDDAVDCVE